jgi:DNA-binding transcriptional MerR regulator
MASEYHVFSIDEAADAAGLEVTIVRHYAELGLIAPAPQGYGAPELAELRCVRRLMDDLELDLPAVEVVLRMRRQILALQEQLRRIERERRTPRAGAVAEWVEAEWEGTSAANL